MDDRKSIFPLVKKVLIMVRRMILNGTSYFGQGAIQEIVTEVNNHHFKKVLVATDPDLIKFGVATKVMELLNQAGIDYEVYDVPHGRACAMLLTSVLKFNAPATGEKYRELARVFGVAGVDEMDQETYRQAAIDAIQQLADDVEIPRSLRDVGAKEEDIPFLAESAFNDACTPGNPRDCTLEEIADIYKSMFR